MGSLTKGLIGKEDLSVQENTNAAETFNRDSSTGGTKSLTKFPDIWSGLGKINIAAALVNSKYVIGGDTTTGRVLRASLLTIEDATDASKIKCTMASRWNGDAITATDNIAKNGSAGSFSLDTDGDTLTISYAGLIGNGVGVLSAQIVRNASDTPHLFVDPNISSNNITLTFRQAQEIATIDLSSLVDTGQIQLLITYITSA